MSIPDISVFKERFLDSLDNNIRKKYELFEEYINNFNERYKKITKTKEEFSPIKMYCLLDDIKKLKENNITSGKVLDMGSGDGYSSLVWAFEGFDVVGVEFDGGLAAILTEEEINNFNNKFELNSNIKILHGNYFPKDFADEKKSELKEQSNTPHTFLDCPEDVYEKNKIDLQEFDIFYAFTWGDDTLVEEMFNKTAKSGAFLVLGSDHTTIKKES